MRRSLAFAAVFAAFALASIVRSPWLFPALAALAAYFAIPPYIAWRGLDDARAKPFVVGRLATLYFAMAWLVALLVATPAHGEFWLVFVGVLAIAGPVILGSRRARSS